MPRSELTWLGQAGFLLESEGTRVLIDPWVSPHEARLTPPPNLDLVTERIAWVLVTHEHLDHLDLPFLRVLAERSPDTRLVLPAPAAATAEMRLPLTTVEPGDRLDIGSLRVEVMPALHGTSMADAYGDGEGRFVGYVIRGPDFSLYHAGDTVVTEGLIEALADKEVEIALLPINGRDFFREQQGIVGNLDSREAVQFARRLGARILIPYHWDGFAGNTERPGLAADQVAAAGDLHLLVLARGLPIRL